MTLGLSPRFPGLNFPPGQERGSVLVIQAPRGSKATSEHVLPPTRLPAEEWPHLGSWGRRRGLRNDTNASALCPSVPDLHLWFFSSSAPQGEPRENKTGERGCLQEFHFAAANFPEHFQLFWGETDFCCLSLLTSFFFSSLGTSSATSHTSVFALHQGFGVCGRGCERRPRSPPSPAPGAGPGR